MSYMKRSIVATSIALILVGVSIWGLLHRQLIQDWITVQRFTPSAQVTELAQRTHMSKEGQFIFYASEPAVDKADVFNVHCSRQETTTAILGCYADGRIYIYQITNKELDGIEEVTAAHEMLHAAWARMSGHERERVSKLLERAYQRVKTPELEERMAYYGQHQPGERANELHSILGTEVTSLGDELERHYQGLFTDRHAVVKLYVSYQGVFSALEAQSAQLKRELDAMAGALNTDIAAYNVKMEQLNQEMKRHNDQLSRVDRTSQSEVAAYNARGGALQREQDMLVQTKASLDERRDVYDVKVQEYNSIVIRSTALVDSIDSFKAPVNKVR